MGNSHSGTYEDFLATKRFTDPPSGHAVVLEDIHASLYPFQAAMTRWTIQRGRAGLFADRGLGKTRMQIAWAAHVPGRTLIVAPLAVTQQTIREAALMDLTVQYVRAPEQMAQQICITNYDMLQHFVGVTLGGICLDESAAIKHIGAKRRRLLLDHFTHIPYRLCCSAMPAPNSVEEMGSQAEFLGVMTMNDMRSTFFVHDDSGWRLRGHAKAHFYRWLASWCMAVRSPYDLGFDGSSFVLPPHTIVPHFLEWDARRLLANGDGQLGIAGTQQLHGITDRVAVRQQTTLLRCEYAVKLAQEAEGQVVLWCGLDEESKALTSLLGDEAYEVKGSQTPEEKERRLMGFVDGERKYLVTKASIAGWGLNFQNAHCQLFVGLNDSQESFYQTTGRLYRYGQKHPVTTHVVLSEHERPIWENVQRKEREAMTMIEGLIAEVKDYEQEELGMQKTVAVPDAPAREYQTEQYHVYNGDSCDVLKTWDQNSIGLAVFSPPFSTLYQYNATERDLGNSKSEAEFFAHFGFIADELLRVLMPGRLVAMHISEIPAMLVRDGWIGMHNFVGHMCDHMTEHGWIRHGEIVITKSPQSQAIRMHPKGLSFTQLRKDASWMRPALVDKILLFRKPGENPIPVISDVDNETWIKWANGVWYGLHDDKAGICETDTLNTAEGRTENDDKHICALQLQVIERCIRLWSNPDERVASPFMGIGSEGYEALRLGRYFVGCELKPSYYDTALKNLGRAAHLQTQEDLFALRATPSVEPEDVFAGATLSAEPLEDVSDDIPF